MTKASMVVLALGAWAAAFAACGDGAETPSATKTPLAGLTPTAEDGGDLRLSSDAFGSEGTIPSRFTCDGDNVSPPLAWEGAPARTNDYALIMDDPDAPGGTFTHWVLYNVGSAALSLPEGVETVPMPADGLAAYQGNNDGGGIGYTGPCPPPDGPHRYRFTLYALDETADLEAGATKDELLSAIEGHILAEAQLVGTYGR
jgi:Raf kinase inhibitor-like YbhB/YbcL family protein